MDSFNSSSPTVAYLGNPSLIGIYLIDELLKRGCKVQIIDEDRLQWAQGVIQLKSSFGFNLDTGKSFLYDYVFISPTLPKVLGVKNLKTQNIEKLIIEALKIVGSNGKIVIALPIISDNKKNLEEQKIVEKYSSKNPSIRVVYVGDIFGKGMDFYDNRPISKVLLDLNSVKKIEIIDELSMLYPVKVEDAAKEILKSFFSYWRIGEVRTATSAINYGNFFLLLKNTYPDLQFEIKSGLGPDILLSEPIPVNKKIENNSFDEVINWIQKKISEQNNLVTPPKRNRKLRKFSIKYLKIYLLITSLLFLFVISPFIILAFSWFAKNSSSANLSKAMFIKWTNVPLIGQNFIPFVEVTAMVSDLLKINTRNENIVLLSSKLLNGVLGKEEYKIEEISDKLFLELDSLYKETSFLEGDTDKLPFAKYLIKDPQEFKNSRNHIAASKEMVKYLPELFSGEKQKSYLVLLQNNQFLRPTGGLIENFALLTFENAKLISSQVFETKKADARLKGFVKPPDPFVKHLNILNWTMIDSNWNLDFTESAKNAEWFLEKEMDIKVDGVIGVDKSIDKLIKGDTSNLKSLADIFINLATQKHIQFYLHNTKAQDAISSIGFNGGTKPPSCGVDCVVLWAGLNEASLGEDNISQSIDRFSRFNINIESKQIDFTYTINLKNLTDKLYKSYLRLMSSKNSTFDSIKIIESGKTIFVDPEITGDGQNLEAGVYFELNKGEEKTIVFNWTMPQAIFNSPGSKAMVFLRKQAGTEGDRVEVVINLEDSQIYSNPVFELTKDGEYRYNTELKRDFSAIINN